MWLTKEHNKDQTPNCKIMILLTFGQKKEISTFSIREIMIFAKQGNDGTNGLRVMRGEAKICKSTT
jgi:hypothetical protein